jgi:TPR repeat protein
VSLPGPEGGFKLATSGLRIMTIRRDAIVAACGASVVALAVMTQCTPALAQSAELVLCDRIAAEPSDPDKPADVTGVATIAPSDIATAIKFCKAASARSPRALYQLGRAYAANKQYDEAIRIYRQAMAKGSTSAMVDLGVMLGTGAGAARDAAEARKLFERAAAAGHPRGITNLAAVNGGIVGNPGQTRDMLAKAADANSAEAQFQLGLMEAGGEGGPKNEVAARVLFEKAAAQGHVEAMVWAGAYALNGRGGPEDKARAKSHFEKAAAMGNDDAKARLKQIECPYVLKDKSGKFISNLCF